MFSLRHLTTLLVGAALALGSLYTVSAATASPAKDKAAVKAFAIQFQKDYLKSKSWVTVCAKSTPAMRSTYIGLAEVLLKKKYKTCPKALGAFWKSIGKPQRDAQRARARRYLKDLPKKEFILTASGQRNTLGYDAKVVMSDQPNDTMFFSKIRGKWYYGAFKPAA